MFMSRHLDLPCQQVRAVICQSTPDPIMHCPAIVRQRRNLIGSRNIILAFPLHELFEFNLMTCEIMLCVLSKF